ncbi:uncharacterized protein LOC133872013 [Alnus glutinosa]|uniref:uncharacterized protein LOC133872013 n=1 Tax=Alnus glutinosa TaxID=3517 RepID=UPI002D7879FB|nr:uncharacterized protein LOC133872013 [Alnus glutinosa]
MARIVIQSLLRRSPLFRPQYLTHAHRSFSSSSARLIEIDLDASSSSSSSSSSSTSQSDEGDGDSESLLLKKLDDLIHRIMVQKSTPDWLPFVPGSSFWVPPRPGTSKVLDLVGRLADQLGHEEPLSLTSSRGWPCSSFFLHGNESTNSSKVDLGVNEPAEVEVEIEVKVLKNSEDTLRSEDEEG